MKRDVLETKLFIPQLLGDIIPRDFAINRLLKGLNKKLTLISAPAGFGKTTLLCSVITSCEKKVVWISLSEEQANLFNFLNYFIAGINKQFEDFDKELENLLNSYHQISNESLLNYIINEISYCKESFIVVLDDFHLVDSEEINSAIEYLIKFLPPHMHIIISTREDPKFSISKLRVNKQINEIRSDILKFNLDQINKMFKLNDIDLSRNKLIELEQKVEGWPAGIYMAAMTYKNNPNKNLLQHIAVKKSLISEYLLDEVLSNIDSNTKDFLLKSSIFEQFTNDLCNSVLELNNNDCTKLIENIYESNLFISSLDSSGKWFRYHHLFRDFLRMRLEHNVTKSIISKLHAKASLWFKNNGFEDEAINHALKSGNFDLIAEILEGNWVSLSNRFQSAKWMNWAEHLPKNELIDRPVMAVHYLSGLLDIGKMEEAKKWIFNIEQNLNLAGKYFDETMYKSIPYSIASSKSYLYQALGDTNLSIQYASESIDLLSENDFYNRWGALNILALANWSLGKLSEANILFLEARTILDKMDIPIFKIASTYALAELCFSRGDLYQAIKIYEDSNIYASHMGKHIYWVTQNHHLGLSKIYIEQGKIKEAREQLFLSKELCEYGQLFNWKYLYLVAKANLSLLTQNYESAISYLKEAEQNYFDNPEPNRSPIDAQIVRAKLKLNKIDNAKDWIKKNGLRLDDNISYLDEYRYITYARILLKEAQLKNSKNLAINAESLLERLHKIVKERNSLIEIVETELLLAIIKLEFINMEDGIELLNNSFKFAESQNIAKLFMDEGETLIKFIDYIDKDYPLVNEIKNLIRNDLSSSDNYYIEPLSRREKEVLVLISEGLSNKEISEKLFLAITTIKGHNQNIFEKLCVRRRTEAIVKAKKLGII